jgi:hypothetical protein
MPEDVAFFVAKNVRSNVRELKARCARSWPIRASTSGISIQLAREALRPAVHPEPPDLVENIQKTVADYYKIKVADMYSKKRPASIARPRQIAMYLAKELTQRACPRSASCSAAATTPPCCTPCARSPASASGDRAEPAAARAGADAQGLTPPCPDAIETTCKSSDNMGFANWRSPVSRAGRAPRRDFDRAHNPEEDMIVLKATQDKVLAALQSVSGIVERRHTLPILANVLMRKNGPMQATSDLEIQIRTRPSWAATPATGHHGGRAQADRHPAHHAGDQTVSLETQQAKLILKGGKSRFTLQTLPAEDFPLVQEAPGFGPAFSVPQKVLKTCWARCLCHGGAGHPLLPQRHPVRGRRQDASLVATDGHRLAASAELDVEVPKQEVILPRKTVLELQRLLSDATGENQPPSRCSSPTTRPSSALAAWSS